MKEKIILKLIGVALGVSGIVVLLSYTDRLSIVVGVLLMLWGNNTEKRARA
jgi:hypothetical protein